MTLGSVDFGNCWLWAVVTSGSDDFRDWWLLEVMTLGIDDFGQRWLWAVLTLGIGEVWKWCPEVVEKWWLGDVISLQNAFWSLHVYCIGFVLGMNPDCEMLWFFVWLHPAMKGNLCARRCRYAHSDVFLVPTGCSATCGCSCVRIYLCFGICGCKWLCNDCVIVVMFCCRVLRYTQVCHIMLQNAL